MGGTITQSMLDHHIDAAAEAERTVKPLTPLLITHQLLMQLPSEFCVSISTRLSSFSDLRLPASMCKDQLAPVDTQQKQSFLSELLQRDPAVFLERYGSLLDTDELSSFQALRGNYEVDYWLNQAEALHAPTPSTSSSRRVSKTVANRRLAYMYRLEKQGEYFSEDSMRAREPLIWHEYIGQFEGQPPPPTGPVPGEGFAGSLLRAHDEVLIRARLQQQLEEEECQRSEHDSDDEEEGQQQQQQGVGDQAMHDGSRADAPAAALAAAAGIADPSSSSGLQKQQQQTRTGTAQQQQQQAAAGRGGPQQQQQQHETQPDMSADAMQQRRQEFLEEMQSRFLCGLDSEHQEYDVIDADAGLDESWAAQQAQDAEDAYFDAD